MTKTPLLALAAISTLAASCATEPRDACTRDWFRFQADDLQRDFVRRNRGPVRRLDTLRTDLRENPDLFTVLALASAKRDATEVIGDFRTRIVPEARAIADRCQIDEAFDIVVDGFLAQQGIDAGLVRTLGLLGELDATPGITMALEGAAQTGLAPTGAPQRLQPMPEPSVKPDGVVGRPGAE